MLLTGIGLRPAHHADFLANTPGFAWLEVHSENYFGEGGKALQSLEKISQHYPISLHGVSLSLGSADELNWQHLKHLQELIKRINPCLVSEHLSWSSINGHYFHDLLPIPYTEEFLKYLVTRIQQVQDYLQRQILIENISSYVQYHQSSIPEHEFLTNLAQEAGCGILLDINNIYVSANNLNMNTHHYIDGIPPALVQELHLAGFSKTKLHEKEVLIDTHNSCVTPEVWDLFAYAINKFGRKPTIIEWDSDLPSLDVLYAEAHRAESIMREIYVATKLAG